MKNFYKFPLFLCIGLGLSLSAQTSIRQTQSGEAHLSPVAENKSAFVKNGNYLYSPNSAQDQNRSFGDSLTGFNEAAYKVDLLARRYFGSEYFIAMNQVKRDYINRRYHIGRYAPPASTPARPAGRPVGGGGNTINNAPCVNEDFESTTPGIYSTGNAVTGWTVESGTNPVTPTGVACNGPVSWTAGSPEFSIVTTPIVGNPTLTPFSIDNVTIPTSPLGGNNIARLQDRVMGNMATRIMSTFPITTANTLFQFAYAGSWDGSGHACCDQPSFTVHMYNCVGDTLTCSTISLTPSGPSCTSGVGGYSVTNSISWTNWVVKYIDLTPFIGSCITIEVINSDCNGGAHHGSAYFDALCGGALVGSGLGGNGGNIGGPVSFCAGSNQAQVNAPLGYSAYQWYAGNPSTPITGFGQGGNTPVLTINNPVPGTVYTVQLVTASGCTFTALDTLKFSSVKIIGLGTGSTCPGGGASGTATVQGNGSGTGYNYTWTGPNGNTNVVGTASVATGLAAGIYTIAISGYGASGCGSDQATVAIGVGPPNISTVIKPYCGNEAYLQTSGTNVQWYNGTTPIAANAGGTAPSYTATSPYNGETFWVTFISQGCKDSIEFFLNQTPPGAMYALNTSYSCPNTANASATIAITPAQSAPPGLNSYSVFSVSSPPTPAYSASLFPTSNNTFVPTNMAAGNYSVIGFDGSCKYSATFTITDYIYDYQVSPQTATLCPNNTLLASVNFTVPITNTQYNFQWSPATWISGGATNTSNISVQIAPVVAPGAIVTQIYTITVIPTAVYCPITKTISVTAINLQTPTFVPIPSFCTNASAKTVTASPTGGSYSTGMGNWLSTFSGIITPSLITTVGTNTFMYTASISTCVVTGIGSFNVAKFNSAALTGTVANQCTTFPCVNLMGIVQSTTNGSWAGLGVNPGSNTFCPGGVPSGVYTLTYMTTSNPYPTLCPDAQTLAVQVDKPIQPQITAVTKLCSKMPAFNMTVTPNTGTWTAGPPQLVSPSGVVNLQYAPTGITTLTYTSANGACISKATTVIDVNTYHSAALTGAIGDQCINSPTINLMSIVQSQVSGNWSGPGVAIPGTPLNVFSPGSVLSAGQYSTTVTLQYNTVATPFPDPKCAGKSTINVNVFAPPTPTITQPLPHCITDGSFQVQAGPVAVGGSFVVTPYLTFDGIYTPSLSLVGNNPIQYVIGTPSCSTTDNKQVSIENYVPPTITGTLADMCNTSPAANLTNLSLNTGGQWVGYGVLGHEFDPNVAVNNWGAGMIVLTYSTWSMPSHLCPLTATLAVNVYSLATPAITGVGPFCNSSPGLQLAVTPLGGRFTGENSLGVNQLGWFSPASARIGANIINYSVTSGPCMAFTQSTIQVEQFISANFSKYPGPFCKNDAPVDLNSMVQNPGGTFGGPGVSGDIFTAANANIGSGNPIVYKTHSEPSELLCPDQTTVYVTVNPNPNVKVSANQYAGCAPVQVVLTPSNTSSGKGAWNLGDGSDVSNDLTATHSYTAPGTYTVAFSYWDELGCSTQTMLAKPIVVYDLPKAAFTYGPKNEVTISDPQVQFTNESNVLGKNTYVWQIGDMYAVNDVNPQITFPKIGQYEITLTATSINGCVDKSSQTIEVKNDFGIYIPNSFTPNDDGLNDIFTPVFTPYGLDAKTFDMEIFDRWGSSIYHTRDVTKGWNGSMQNRGGDKLKEDVYVYKIKYKDVEGVIYDKLGYITLIR